MKILIKAIIVLLLASPASSAIAQTETNYENKVTGSTAPNYALLVRTEDHLKAAIKTAEALLQSNTGAKFEIVVCGEAVELLQQGSALMNIIEKATAGGAEVVACGMSLEKQKVERKLLMQGIRIEENGLIRIFQLQKEGYFTIEL